MIGYLKGILIEKTPESAILDVSGVGYEVSVPMSNLCVLPIVGQPASLYIHTHVREDSIRLFGFATLLDRKVFETLITVSGVGPKLAITLMSQYSGQDLCEMISGAQLASLVKIPGVGAKTAERLILELKDKLLKLASLWDGFSTHTAMPTLLDSWDADPKKKRQANSRVIEDLKMALVALGYKDKQTKEAVSTFEKRMEMGEEISLEAAIRDSLKRLSGHLVSN